MMNADWKPKRDEKMQSSQCAGEDGLELRYLWMSQVNKGMRSWNAIRERASRGRGVDGEVMETGRCLRTDEG